MGRSVNYHSDAYKVLYTHIEYSETHEDEEGNEVDNDRYDDQFEWDSFVEMLEYGLKEVAPSLEPPRKVEWYDREVRKILENNLCSVWLSEYCGLVSLSFVPEEEGYSSGKAINGLAERWINQMIPKFQEQINPSLRKVGTMSNGEAIFEKIN